MLKCLSNLRPGAGAVILLIGGAAPVAIQAQSDLPKVAAFLRQADAAQDVARCYDFALRISDLDLDEDRLASELTDTSDDVGPFGRVTAAVAMRDLAEGSAFGKRVFEILRPVIESGANVDATLAAIAVLGDENLLNRRTVSPAQDLLTAKVTDELVDPRIRLRAALGLWQIGTERQQVTAKDTAEKFLRSSDRSLQVSGALALAEMNQASSSKAWEVLREIQHQPTAEGRLAKSFLDREKETRRYDSHLSMLLQRIRSGGATSGNSNDQFATMRELLDLISATHMRGDAVDDQMLLEQAYKGLLQALDRHSTYFTSDEFERFFFDLNREYAGIGAFVNFDRDDVFSIVRPIYSGPAYRAGLKSGDKILEVDGWETIGHTSDEIIRRLKGKPATRVVVKIMRPGFSEPKDVPITREEVQVPSVNYEMLPGNVGYLEVVTFARDTATEARQALRALEKQGAVGYVLDVRNNTGGYMEAAVRLVELFVPGNKLVVYTEGRAGRRPEELKTDDVAVVPSKPLTVLINNLSASASEITAGALQDLGRATLVGERSFGKGSVQSLMPLQSQPREDWTDLNGNRRWDQGEPFDDRNGNGKHDVGPHVKLTIAYYYLPSGRSIHRELDSDGVSVNPDWGVRPDIEMSLRATSPLDAWRNAMVFELLRDGAFKTYVQQHFDEHQELFLDLAENDGGVSTRYPGFEEFYTGLQTKLDRDDVRRWIRYEIRDRVSDLRGKAFPGGRTVGDPQEDRQLQTAAMKVLEGAGADIKQTPGFAKVLKIFDENGKLMASTPDSSKPVSAGSNELKKR